MGFCQLDFSRKRAIVFGLLLFFITFGYQNCNQNKSISFEKKNSSITRAPEFNGNGTGFEGKPEPGAYYRYYPNFNCGNLEGDNTQASVEVDKNNILLQIDNCNLTNYPISLSSPQVRSVFYNPDYFVLGDAIFRKDGLTPNFVPEYLCRYNGNIGVDVVIEIEPSTQKVLTNIYYGKIPAQGPAITLNSFSAATRIGGNHFVGQDFDLDIKDDGINLISSATLTAAVQTVDISQTLSCLRKDKLPILPSLQKNPFQFAVQGEQGGALFGSSLKLLGDYNGDGTADFTVGATYFADTSGTRVGKVYIYSGLDQTILFSKEGSASSGRSSEVDGLGDTNGDGYSDVAIANSGCDSTDPAGVISGTVTVYSGKDNSVRYTLSEPSALTFGCSIVGLGDINGDGHGDIAVGAELARNADNSSTSGRVYIYSGFDGAFIAVKYGTSKESSGYGNSIKRLGDINGDSISDFAISAPYENANGIYDSGRIYVYSGSDLSQLFTLEGERASDNIGYNNMLRPAGDVNNDGYNDIIFSTHGRGANYVGPARNGKVYVYSGKDQSLLFSKTGDVPGDGFGKSVAGDFDFNGDGYYDFAYGVNFHFGIMGVNAGKIYIHSGKDNSLLHVMEGEAPHSELGGVMTSVGDINGDGKDDLMASAYHYHDDQDTQAGKVYIIKGH